MSQPLDSIICFFGDIHSARLDKHEKNKIKRGIVSAAFATGAQFMCSVDGGMSKFVKDAINFNLESNERPQIYVKTFSKSCSLQSPSRTDHTNTQQENSDSLEDYLLENKAKNTPVTCVVIGGDIPLLESITKIARHVDNIHVIFVEGSGRAADFLSLSCNHAPDSSDTTECKFSNVFDVHFDGTNRAELDIYYKQWQLMKNKMTLWSLEGEKRLDVAIENALFTLFQGLEIGIDNLLAIISAWDRYDIAEQNIHEMSNFLDSNKQVLKKHLMNGLIHNKIEFVRKLMKIYDDFEGSLTPKELYYIYKRSVDVAKEDRATEQFMTLLFPLEVTWPDHEDKFFSNVGNLVKKLLADEYLNPYSKRFDDGSCLKKVCSKDLFCWALLLNKYELATLFWIRGEHYTCAALFASALLRKLSRHAKELDDTDLYRTMKNNAMNFERYAIAIVNRMRATRCDVSKQLIVSVVDQYGKTTPLYIAGRNNLMDFMEQAVCQSKLNDIWFGNLALNTSKVKILGCIFLPFLLLPSIQFKGKDCTRKTQPEKLARNRRYFTVLSSKKENRIGPCDAFLSFYSAPAIKFMVSLMFYVTFLMIFSVMILSDLKSDKVSSLEIVVMLWALSLYCDECRQVVEEDQPSHRSKMALWFADSGNKLDAFAHLMLLVSASLRLYASEDSFKWTRYFYSLTLVIFWWLSIRFLFVHRHIGPKIVMIGKMFKDLVFLLLFFVVVVISVGIAYTANLYPNSIIDWSIVKKIGSYPFWQIHGELSLEYLRGDEPDPSTCTDNPLLYNNGTLPVCPVQFDMITLLAVGYLTLTNIILLNVLIAMFSYTFQKVQSKAGKVARFHNYFLVYEYSNMPALVVPLNFFYLPYKLVLLLTRKKRSNKFKMTFTEKEKQVMKYNETEALEQSVLGTLIRKDFKVIDEAALKP